MPPPPPEPAPPPPVAIAAPMAPAEPAAASSGPKFTWGGLVDTYYQYLLNPGTSVNSLVGVQGRAFDTNTNSATLALSALTLNASLDPVSFQLDLGYGSIGTIVNSFNFGGTPATIPVTGQFIILQAYGSIAVLPMLTFDFGKFYTTAGAEVLPANKNWLYSRSILFKNIPVLHTGARANLKINDMLSLQASLVNGWNDDPDFNAHKTVGFSATLTPAPIATIVATTYIGKEAPQTDPMTGAPLPSTPGETRILVDLVAALTFSDKLGVNLNFDYIKSQNSATDSYLVGGAGMVRYVINNHINIAGRGEFVRIRNVGVNQDLMEGTVMVGLPVGRNFELRPEFRIDFLGQDAVFATGESQQITGTLAALTYF